MSEISRLPLPLFSNYEWQFLGACVEEDSQLFFHPDGERGPARRARDRAAVAVCAGCPVIASCRSHGLSVQEAYGVWGGLTESDREVLIVRQRHSTLRTRSSGRLSLERPPSRSMGSGVPETALVETSIAGSGWRDDVVRVDDLSGCVGTHAP